jgi:hypothetical protein
MDRLAKAIEIKGTLETGKSFFTLLENRHAFEPSGLVGANGTKYLIPDKDSPVFLIAESENGRLSIGGNTNAAGFLVLGMPRGTNLADLPKMVADALKEAAELAISNTR